MAKGSDLAGTKAAAAAGRRRTQEERRREAETRLLDAAIGLIAERGILNTSLGDVGEAAGYSRGLPSHHFKAKAGLTEAVRAEILRRMAERMSPPAGVNGLEALCAVIRAVLAGVHEPLTSAFLEFQKAAIPQESADRQALTAFHREVSAKLEVHVRAGQATGEIRADVDPNAQAHLLLISLRGVLAQQLLSADPPSIEAAVAALERRTRRALAA